jgi:hypothetical protein
MKQLTHNLILAAAICGISGCATMLAGGPDHVSVATNPPGATVFVDNKPVGQTPAVVELDRAHSHGQLRIELPGFMPVTVVRDKVLNQWIWASFVMGGLIGIGIDIATSNATRFEDEPVAIGLTPSSGGAALPPPPPTPKLQTCREERRRTLIEAMKLEDHHQRVQMINSAPVCD